MGKRQLSEGIKKDISAFKAYSFSQKVQMLPLEKVLPNDKNFYRVNDEEVSLLMEDIETQGVKHNLVVKANGDGTYTIISGHKRREAVRRLVEEKGYAPTLPCLVDSYNSEDEEMQALIMLNVTNRKLTDSELLKGYEELRAIFERQKADKQVKGRIRELVAEALQVSNSQVRKIENINNHAVEEVKTLINEGKMSIHTADKIAELDTETQKKVIADSDISKLKEIKPKDIEKTSEKVCAINDTKTENKKCVTNDTNTDNKKCVTNDTSTETKTYKKELVRAYTPENIRHALEILFYKNDEIQIILNCLEKNTH
jgi:ParB family chromosome partitioning protein